MNRLLGIWTSILALGKQNFERYIVNKFYPSTLKYVLGAQKNRLIETVLLSTHNICFGLRNKKIYF